MFINQNVFALADEIISSANGFDNIVFYDSTNAHGKYVYDDESAYYSFGDENKAAYIEKYGHTPNCKDNKTDVNPTNVAPGGISFGLKRVEVDQAPNQTDCVSHELRRMERNMSEIAFFGELVAFMKETSFVNSMKDRLIKMRPISSLFFIN